MASLFFARGLWSLVFSGFFSFFLTAGIAFGSLYPTKPISTTVLAAGRPAQVKWVEDGRRPLLGDMGHMKIHLLAGNNTYLCTIAEDVSPLSLSTTVFIPQIIPANYHIYTLRFIPLHTPHHPIYTSPFTILPNPFSYLLTSSHPTNSIATPSSPHSSEIVGTPDVTPATRAVESQTPMPTAPGKFPPSRPESGGASGRFELGMGWRPGRVPSAERTTARRVPWNLDMEKMKFRLVFVVWPALIGLSLSI